MSSGGRLAGVCMGESPATDVPVHIEENARNLRLATLVWVHWFNTSWFLEPIGDVPPSEFEVAYYQEPSQAMAL